MAEHDKEAAWVSDAVRGDFSVSVRQLSDADLAELRSGFRKLGFEESRLRNAFGTAAPPIHANRLQFIQATRQDEALSTLARLFLGGLTVPLASAEPVLPARFLRLCIEAGLLNEAQGGLTPRVLIVPLQGLLFASDAVRKLGSAEAGDFVLPATTHASRHLVKLTIRRRVGSTLDLGTGSGVQALIAAAHSDHVVATDASPRAVQYAEFNARLNGLARVECLVGDRFAPVAGRRFDLIVSNPPFVPGPSRAYSYRDAGTDLDSFCRSLVEQAPAMLNPDGMLQMLCEWVEIEGEPWEQRLRAWTRESGCDCWVLRSPPQSPEAYAALRVAEIAGPEDPARAGNDYAAWLSYFTRHRVIAIHPGVIMLRRRNGPNWFQMQALGREIGDAAGDGVLRQIESNDYLAKLGAGDSLLGDVLCPAPGLRVDQSHLWSASRWQVDRIVAWVDAGLPLDAELDPAAAALLRQFDGSTDTRECLRRLAALLGRDESDVLRTGLPVVRFLLERGLLMPPARRHD